MPLGEQQAQHTAGQVCPGHPVLLRAWPKSLPSKIPLLGMAEARPQSGVSLFPQLFPRPMCRPSFRSSWGFQIPLCEHKEQVSPPACPQQPTSPPALSFPPLQVWDERLARAAEAWAVQCVWDHGPPQLMKYVGQNLSIHSGR